MRKPFGSLNFLSRKQTLRKDYFTRNVDVINVYTDIQSGKRN